MALRPWNLGHPTVLGLIEQSNGVLRRYKWRLQDRRSIVPSVLVSKSGGQKMKAMMKKIESRRDI
jgi:hypothetical protein